MPEQTPEPIANDQESTIQRIKDEITRLEKDRNLNLLGKVVTDESRRVASEIHTRLQELKNQLAEEEALQQPKI